MPAPKNTPQATPDAPATDAQGAPKKGEHNPFVHSLLEDAQALKDRKTALLAEIDDNRTTLRTVARTGFLSKDQADAIVQWYPMPNRAKKGDAVEGDGTTEATEATTTGATA